MYTGYFDIPRKEALMGRAIGFVVAAILATFLWATHYYPASPLFWVASITTAFTVLRTTLVVVLLWLFVYAPRTKWLRVPLGFSTIALTVWLLDVTYQGSMGAIDSLTLLAATIAILTILLESKPKDEEFMSLRFIAALCGWASERVQIAASWAYQFGWLLLTDLDLSLEEYYQRIGSERTGLTHRHQPRHA